MFIFLTHTTLLFGLPSLLYSTPVNLILTVQYDCTQMTCKSQSFNFSESDLTTARDCMCGQSSDECSYNHIDNKGGWKWRGGNKSGVHKQGGQSYECGLIQGDFITCVRKLNKTPNVGYMSWRNDTRSENICANISWNPEQRPKMEKTVATTIYISEDERKVRTMSMSSKGTVSSIFTKRALTPTAATKKDVTITAVTNAAIKTADATTAAVTNAAVTYSSQMTFPNFEQTSLIDANVTTTEYNASGKTTQANKAIIFPIGILAAVSIVFGVIFLFVKLKGRPSSKSTMGATDDDHNYDYVTLDGDAIERTDQCPAETITDETRLQRNATVSKSVYSDVRYTTSGNHGIPGNEDVSIQRSNNTKVYARFGEKPKAFQHLYNTDSDISRMLSGSDIIPVTSSTTYA